MCEGQDGMKKAIFFFIGTEAELIKIFPVILECQKAGGICHIIASGQNDLKKNRILDYIDLNGKYVELSREENIQKSIKGLLYWFLNTKVKALKILKQSFTMEEFAQAPMVVHGDTVSTVMGALIGRQLRMKVCHVEAGLRSHHLFNPFPEEIDRLLTSKIARVHFAPGSVAKSNLQKAKGKVYDTQYNTILDSLAISREIPIITEKLESIIEQDYFVFVMHRQENLLDKKFFTQVLARIEKVAEQRKCVLILHKITENALAAVGELEKLEKNSNFILIPRMDYFDFMKLLYSSQFVITDGGSNQEELFYMGKPCIIMRKATERNEGIDENALLYGGSMDNLDRFVNEYKRYEREVFVDKRSPSELIAAQLKKNI